MTHVMTLETTHRRFPRQFGQAFPNFPNQNSFPSQQYPQQYFGPQQQFSGPPQQFSGPQQQFSGAPQQNAAPPQQNAVPQATQRPQADTPAQIERCNVICREQTPNSNVSPVCGKSQQVYLKHCFQIVFFSFKWKLVHKSCILGLSDKLWPQFAICERWTLYSSL